LRVEEARFAPLTAMASAKGMKEEDDDSIVSNESNDDCNTETYESIMSSADGVESLTLRLKLFREWILKAGCEAHLSMCIVNGEDTDGTTNVYVLVIGSSLGAKSKSTSSEGRCGTIDGDADQELYDRTIGCQLRTTREMKENQVLMTIPKGIMITPDLVAASDAGMAIHACCQPINSTDNFWDAFSNTTEKEQTIMDKVATSSGTQLLVKILQERKKIGTELTKAAIQAQQKQLHRTKLDKQHVNDNDTMPDFTLAEKSTITSRAAVLCFLIHQRFSNHTDPKVSARKKNGDAPKTVPQIPVPTDSPVTFAPYMRTLPPLVPLPICWKRPELALLAGCVTGVPLLQEVAAQIMTLSSDLMSLLKAGILHRFPSIISPNLLTWDRWVWAASTHMSRILPASCYFNNGEDKAIQHKLAEGETFYSPPEIWDELGVMIPLLDMLNHESEASQIIYKAPPPPGSNEETDPEGNAQINETSDTNASASVAKVVIHKRVKKGSQIYTNYSVESNKQLMLSYGFAQISNPSDTVPIGWGLIDCVGNVPPPPNYVALDEVNHHIEDDKPFLVFDSSDKEAINSWWTKERLTLLESEIQSDMTFWNLLRKGKKFTATANCDGTYNPILLTAVVVATMTPGSLKKRMKLSTQSNGNKNPGITITKRHQRIIQRYLLFLFSQKFEKLMQNFNHGLQDHFNHVKLWTKPTNGGLAYDNSTASDASDECADVTGWQFFFDSYAYAAAMEIEKRYYSMSPDSCVLTLYDGHLRSLEASINGVVSQNKFEEGVLKQLEELGFIISDTDTTDSGDECNSIAEDGLNSNNSMAEDVLNFNSSTAEDGLNSNNSMVEDGLNANEVDEPEVKEEKLGKIDTEILETPKEIPSPQQQQHKKDAHNGDGNDDGDDDGGGGRNNNEADRRDRRNRRNRRRNGPPAMKLHIGNLSFQTNPSALFEFFAKRYGRDSVLECHIPTQRESGKSRGFGFVTMSELTAIRVLQSDDIHEIDGRKVKVAESNTAGGTRGNHHSAVGVSVSNDRCKNCGYRPRYCTCSTPNTNHGFPRPTGGGPLPIMGGSIPAHYAPGDDMYRPDTGSGLHGVGIDPQDHPRYHGRNNINPDFDVHDGGRHRSRSRNRGRSYSRSHSPRYRSGSSRANRSRDGRYHDRSYRDRRNDRSYSRSRSRSYSRSRSRRDRRGRDSGRESERDREGRRRSRKRRGSSSRSDWRSSSRFSPSRSLSRSQSRSQSYSKGTQSSSRRGSGGEVKRDRDSKSSIVASSANLESSTLVRSPSASSLPQEREIETGLEKRDSGKSRRSRSKSRDRSSRPRKRNKGSRRSKDVSKRRASRSRTRSRSRSWKD